MSCSAATAFATAYCAPPWFAWPRTRTINWTRLLRHGGRPPRRSFEHWPPKLNAIITKFSASPATRAMTKSRAPIASWRCSITRTATLATMSPRSASRSAARPTRCSATSRSAPPTTASAMTPSPTAAADRDRADSSRWTSATCSERCSASAICSATPGDAADGAAGRSVARSSART